MIVEYFAKKPLVLSVVVKDQTNKSLQKFVHSVSTGPRWIQLLSEFFFFAEGSIMWLKKFL